MGIANGRVFEKFGDVKAEEKIKNVILNLIQNDVFF